MKSDGYLYGSHQLDEDHGVPKGRAIGGFSVGVLCIDSHYPMLPGNVVNGMTYGFPVLPEVVEGVTFKMLAAANPEVMPSIAKAGQKLVRLGVRAIVGACGSFANYQKEAAAAFGVPTFMSIMMHVPLLAASIGPNRKVGVICAVRSAITDRVLDQVSIADPDRMVLCEARDLPEFRNIVEGTGHFNSRRLEQELVGLAQNFVREHPEIGVILLQCSDLPPYAASIQQATGRPVFDMTTLVHWVHKSVVRHPFDGYC
ncbi:aspartate/glutamate racemase family protein [Mesorhizobium sp. CO1-1-8]|uniref:aspartate/glutamate racemase family protein n=1 Tax=Mesorhizobium sp. CO1-1-8 TaxID=2876631 RepID=UPI001CD1711A|nr:aspartate/glutamate racemase family protein [Mesorhizobium sp. CO1-1-8]MBZ9772218.1 aspartate/glutamate racemase family protein [Mesorhizobium sp. CO1-1-8]